MYILYRQEMCFFVFGRLNLNPVQAAHEWLERYLEAADTATDFVLTGPATNLNWALQRAPYLASKVGRVFWMAGAVDVDGNIRDSDDDKAQERDCYDGWSLQMGNVCKRIWQWNVLLVFSVCACVDTMWNLKISHCF